MKKTTRRRSKYYAPQNEGAKRPCDHPGCCEEGEFRAPKDRNLKEYYWFCLKHVQEYNARWNYYDGVDSDEGEKEEQKRRRFRFGAKVKYNFGFDFNGNFEFFDNYDPDFSPPEETYFSADDLRCLKIMELKKEGLTVEVLKKQYKKLVKKYHPDLNQGAKEAEEKFKQLSAAYRQLLERMERFGR